ncbi:MAG TPA: translocation/assembly module TamB domain-containing protein, partial [Polyangiales bacterium]|nr:translocation/assembly module TamB domain-containing protein [Polyangiales bacterium]
LHANELRYADADSDPWSASVNLRSAESHVVVDARLDPINDAGMRPYRVQGKLDRVASRLLAAFWADAAIDPASGTVRAHGTTRPDFASGSLFVDMQKASYAAMMLPDTRASGRWSPRAGLILPSVMAKYPSASLEGSFAARPDGCLTVRALLSAQTLERLPPVQRFAPDARGAALVSASLDSDRDGTLHVRAGVDLTSAGYADFASKAMHAELSFDGRDYGDALVDVALRAQDVRSPQLDLPRAELRVKGGPSRYFVSADFASPYKAADRGGIDIRVDRHADRYQARGRAELLLADGQRARLDFTGLEYRLEHELRIADLRASYGASHAQLSGVLDPEGVSRVRLRASTERLSVFRMLALSADLSADRSQPGRDPKLGADVNARFQLEGDASPTHAVVQLGYDRNKLELSVVGEDAAGYFLRTKLGTTLTKKRVSFAPADVPDFVATHAWDASLWLAMRRIGELPGAHLLGVSPSLLPAYVSADARLEHVPKRDPEGALRVQARWRPEPSTVSQACGLSARPELLVTVRMHDGVLESDSSGKIAGRDALRVSTSSRAPFDEWFRTVTPRAANAVVTADDVQLGALPVLCEQVQGRVSGRIALERALSNAVQLQANLRGSQLRVGHAPPFEAVVNGSLDHDHVLARAELRSPTGSATLEARLPLDRGGRMPTVPLSAPIEGRADLRNVDVPALVAAIPAITSRGGTLAGHVDVRGSLRDPAVYGELALHDVTLLLPELGQPFEHVEGNVHLRGRTLVLDRTHVRDREGKADLSGTLTLRSMQSLHAEIEMKADDLPIRRGGVILARLDGRTKLVADVTPERTEVAITLRKASVALTDASLAGVQSLRPDPRVHLVDDRSPPAEADTGPSAPLFLTIDASEPFWMRRDDFSVLIGTHLKVVSRDGTPEVTGTVEIQRGIIALVGQTFDIERGRIEFSGGHEIEPTLALTAVRKVPGGSTVGLEASGTLRTPTLRFTVDDQPVTAGEALAAAAGTRTSAGSASNVEQQVGSMASGIAAGVLTLGARKELGEWVPVLAIETDERETRVRAGIEARRLVPKFMRKVVVDAYVEGILAASKDGSTPAASNEDTPQTNASVLLELRFPHDLVGEAEVGAQHWSTDLSWEP